MLRPSVNRALFDKSVEMRELALGPASAAHVAAGKATAESCAGCQGADGISQAAEMPSLAGEPDD